MYPFLSGRLVITDLLQYKALPPLDASAHAVLARTQSLDVTTFTEADVREEIISPLLGVLGYDIQSYFSIEREKPIQLLGSYNFLDYNLTLWSESFWLIEAKKPSTTGAEFGAGDISQAVGYAVHPEINAALVVLCDGRKISVFDREENQRKPVLTVQIVNLQRDIDRLRSILSPWQVWFFEKRRIVRHLDKVFDKEFNIGRLEEFKNLVTQRLDSKRRTVIDNMRSVVASADDTGPATESLRSTGAVDLIEGVFFLSLSVSDTRAIAETLVGHCQENNFRVIHRVFPDHARDMNDQFCMHALNLLIHLHKESSTVDWLPAWLGGGRDLEGAIKRFIAHCLTHFACDPVRRNILLSASGLRRLFKIIMVVDEGVWRVGQVRHVLERYKAPEDNWEQIVSSPAHQNLLNLDGVANVALARMIQGYSDSQGRPQPRSIETQLREIWKAELSILEAVSPYQQLLEERDLGEVHLTEKTDVVYDSLGHGSLCIVDDHPIWRDYILEHHRNDVETLAQIGSWQARRWLGMEEQDSYPGPTDETLAGRFFLSSVSTYRRLRSAYGYI